MEIFNEVEISNIIRRSLVIHKKFPPLHAQNLLECYDKLLINLQEEMVEVTEETKFSNLCEKGATPIYEELIDVTCYTSTIIACLLCDDITTSDVYNQRVYETLENCLTRLCNNSIHSIEVDKPISRHGVYMMIIGETFRDHIYENILARRSYPNRKWHKVDTDASKEKELTCREELVRKNFHFFIEYLYMLASMKDNNLHKVMEDIRNKQEFTINLHTISEI